MYNFSTFNMRSIPLLSAVFLGFTLVACTTITDTEPVQSSSSSAMISSVSSSADPEAVVASPKVDEIVKSPLKVRGKAKSSWFFEGSLPVVLVDRTGAIIAQGPGVALTDWTQPGWVEFEVELTFDPPVEKDGEVVIKKDNPSGLPENDASIRMPVHFE